MPCPAGLSTRLFTGVTVMGLGLWQAETSKAAKIRRGKTRLFMVGVGFMVDELTFKIRKNCGRIIF
jgi:hypothetical protein